jgi:hypothetical protein
MASGKPGLRLMFAERGLSDSATLAIGFGLYDEVADTSFSAISRAVQRFFPEGRLLSHKPPRAACISQPAISPAATLGCSRAPSLQVKKQRRRSLPPTIADTGVQLSWGAK